jgi:hypothetical protein
LSLSDFLASSEVIVSRKSVFCDVLIHNGLCNLEGLFKPGGIFRVKVVEVILRVSRGDGSGVSSEEIPVV